MAYEAGWQSGTQKTVYCAAGVGTLNPDQRQLFLACHTLHHSSTVLKALAGLWGRRSFQPSELLKLAAIISVIQVHLSLWVTRQTGRLVVERFETLKTVHRAIGAVSIVKKKPSSRWWSARNFCWLFFLLQVI